MHTSPPLAFGVGGGGTIGAIGAVRRKARGGGPERAGGGAEFMGAWASAPYITAPRGVLAPCSAPTGPAPQHHRPEVGVSPRALSVMLGPPQDFQGDGVREAARVEGAVVEVLLGLAPIFGRPRGDWDGVSSGSSAWIP